MPDEFGVDPHIRTPYIQNYNRNLQQEISKHMVLEVGYVGSNGHKLRDFRDINQPTAYPGFLANADFNGISNAGRGQGFYPLTVTGDVGIGYPFLGGGGPRTYAGCR